MVHRKQVDNVLVTYQTGLQTLLFIRGLFLILWVFSTIVEGMGDVIQEAGFNAISHLGFWCSIEFLSFMIGFSCLITHVQSQRKDRSVLKFYWYTLFLAIAANIIHIVASILEYVECATLLCVKNNGFLIAITVMFGVLIGIEFTEMYFVYKYRKTVKINLN